MEIPPLSDGENHPFPPPWIVYPNVVGKSPEDLRWTDYPSEQWFPHLKGLNEQEFIDYLDHWQAPQEWRAFLSELGDTDSDG